ncbi:MAG: MFS transporter [Firmicutes bacterium]|nr:MFS transporter [Bacillota bacterium]
MEVWKKLAYSFGALGSSVLPNAFATFGSFFFTDVMKLQPAAVTLVMTLYSIWNAANDPLLGYISDRTRTRWGRRIPYVVAGTLPMAVLFALIWLPPFAPGSRPLLIYFAVIIMLYDTAYTAAVLNWTALFPEMYPDLGERAQVSFLRQLFGNLGLVLGVSLAPVIRDAVGGWGNMGLTFAAVALLAMGASIWGSREDPRFSQAQALNVLQALRYTLANRSFLTYVLTNAAAQFCFLLLMAAIPYYSKYVLKIGSLQQTIIFGSVFLMVFLFLYPWNLITVRQGPRKAMMAALVLFGLSLAPLALAQNFWQAVAGAAFMGVGLAGIILLFDVLLADIIDEDELRTGQRREGMYFGIQAIFIRLDIAAQTAILMWLLTAYGYNPVLKAQPGTVTTGIRLAIGAVPLLGVVAAFLGMVWYPLHGRRLAEIKSQLAQRRGATANA